MIVSGTVNDVRPAGTVTVPTVPENSKSSASVVPPTLYLSVMSSVGGRLRVTVIAGVPSSATLAEELENEISGEGGGEGFPPLLPPPHPASARVTASAMTG